VLVSASLRQAQESYDRALRMLAALGPDAPAVVRESAERLELANGSRLLALPSRERTSRGYARVAALIVDEAARCADDVYYSLRPMTAIGQGKIVLLSSPAGRRGFFHSVWSDGGDAWRRVRVRADQCARLSPEWLAAERLALGPWWAASELDAEFGDTLDAVFDCDTIRRALTRDVEPLFPEEVA
jgi:hypothetical protein